MYVDPGDLDKKILIIERIKDGQNDAGFETGVEERVVRDCWAQVTNTSGKELMQTGRKLAEAKKRFLVRYTDTEITTSMIIRYAGHEYDIQYVNTYGDSKEYLEIWTEWKAAV